MQLSKRKLAILALISANIIWGVAFPIYKWTLTDVPPFTFVYLRFFLAALLIFPFIDKKIGINKEDVGKLIAYSVLGITSISFLVLGLRLAPSINAPIIYSSEPIILILFSIFYLKEKPKKKVITGTIISLLGVLIIILRPILENGFNLAVLGNIFFVLACITDAVSIVILEKIMKKYPTLTIVFWSFLIGSAAIFPFVAFEQFQNPFLREVTVQGIIGIGYGVVLAAAIAHSCFAFGAKYIKTGEIGIFAYIDPIATALVAIPLLGEKITLYYLLGALFVFGGIFIAEGRIHYHPIHLLRKGS